MASDRSEVASVETARDEGKAFVIFQLDRLVNSLDDISILAFK
jgi:hypothetical protein